MPAVLALREYEWAAIGDRWDPDRKQVSLQAAALLEAVQAEHRSEIVSVGRHSIQAQQWVGTVGLGEQALDLLPKIDRSDTPAVRGKLMSMLEIGGLMPHLDSGEAQVAGAGETLLDSYLALFVRRLAREWRRGPIRDYQREKREREYLRGKLVVSEQIRLATRRPHRFVTSADELTIDAPLSRLLKAALVLCHRHAVGQSVRHDARSLLGDFEAVSELPGRYASLAKVRWDRRHARFDSLGTLARMLLALRSPDRPGEARTFTLVFDMNVVFERYVAALVARVAPALGLRVTAQESSRSLLLQAGRARFALRPDIAIYDRGRLRCLIDTKWKRLDRSLPHAGVSQADMYQMYAYGKEYQCPRVVLLYPRHGDLPEHVTTYHHPGPGSDNPVIEVRTIDVGAAPNEVAAALRALIGDDGFASQRGAMWSGAL